MIDTAVKRPVDSSWVEKFLFIVDNRRELLPLLVQETINQQPKPDIWAGDAVSYLNEDELSAIIAFALAKWRADGSNDSAEVVLKHAAMQFPHLLREHLPELFEAASQSGGVSNALIAAWHGAQVSQLDWLKPLLDDNRDARRALLETREPAAFNLIQRAINDEKEFALWPLEVGYHEVEGKWQPLYCAEHRHLSFALEYWGQSDRPAWISYDRHPTWTAKGNGPPQRFGGWGAGACGGCNGQLHHLLTLDPMPDYLGVSLSRLQLEVCLSCLGWDAMPLFYAHDEGGVPRALDEEKRTPQFVTGPFQETHVTLAATGARWQWQDWGLTNARENLHRVGGHPTWIQSAQYPQCPQCEQTMKFLMQLDSDLPMNSPDDCGGAWLWGSGGIGTLFWCDACRVSGHLLQCT